MPEQRLAGAVEQDLIHAVTGDGLLADRLEIPEQSVQSALGVGGPLLLQVAQDSLGELPGRPHAVQVRAVDVGFPGRPFLFGELEAVCASALSNALAADGARKPEDGAVGAGDDLEGHRRLSIRWLMAISSNSTRRPALMTGGPCRATSRRRVRSASRRRAAVSAKVNRAGAVSGKTNSSCRAGGAGPAAAYAGHTAAGGAEASISRRASGAYGSTLDRTRAAQGVAARDALTTVPAGRRGGDDNEDGNGWSL